MHNDKYSYKDFLQRDLRGTNALDWSDVIKVTQAGNEEMRGLVKQHNLILMGNGNGRVGLVSKVYLLMWMLVFLAGVFAVGGWR